MFTWIPIHEETALSLLEFKDHQSDLIDIMGRMHAAGLKVSKMTDKGHDGSRIPLQEIDPFTFLCIFNRSLRIDNRQALWQFLKDEWKLKSEVPQDFEGIPVANMQNPSLLPAIDERSPDHVTLLWKFFEHIISVEPVALDSNLMQECLNLPQVGLAMLTMGMFWTCPKKWISADGKNLSFAKAKGIDQKLKTAADYVAWLPRIREVIGGDGVEFSLEAHLWATGSNGDGGYGPPFDKLFPDQNPDQLLDYFARVIGILREEAENPGELLSMTLRKKSGGIIQIRINIWMWAVTSIAAKPGRRMIEFLVPFDHPEAVRHRNETKGDGREPSKGFADVLEGVRFDLSYLEEAEFFERFEELWPSIEYSVRALSRQSSGKRSPFRGNHRPELEVLCVDKEQREMILAKGMSFRAETEVLPAGKRRYWLVAPGEGAKKWDQWTEQNIAALGWGEIGDLNAFATKADIQVALESEFPERGTQSNTALMLWNLSRVMKEGDVVFAKLGRLEVIGWGVVAGPLSYNPEFEELQNVIPVNWEEKKAIKHPDRKLLPTKALTDITDDLDLLRILTDAYSGVPGLESKEEDIDELVPEPTEGPTPYGIDDALAELFMTRDSLEHILEQLRRKKNIILQGAPGVGKTFIAKRLAWLHLGAKDKDAVEMVQFHQSYTYEDFVQGLRPTQDGHFAVKDGSFYRLCRKALANPRQDYFLVIDEINRGNLSKILGELMMLIETDKRGQEMTLAYSEEPFTVPANLYLIGTMNTADRSLSLVDYALRRRFAFLTLDPGFETEAFETHLGHHGIAKAQIEHIRWQMATLNEEIAKDEANLGSGYRIGHSFFTPTAAVSDFRKWFLSIVRYEILPLLEEYWIDDPKKLQQFRLSLTEGMP